MASQTEVKEALAELIASPELKVWAFMPDGFKPPGAVIQQARIRWTGGEATFGTRDWFVPVALAVPRANDRAGQLQLDRLIDAVDAAVSAAPLTGSPLKWVQVLDAEPAVITAAGVDYPGYLVNLHVLA